MRGTLRTARPGFAMMVALACASAAGLSLPGSSPAAEPTAAQGGADAHRAKRMYKGPGLKPFVEAYRSWELKDWPATVEGMEAALAADADQSDAQVRMNGNWIVTYIPSYYLSLARCRLGRCEDASAERQKVLNLIRAERDDVRKRYETDCHEGCQMGSSPPP